MRPGLRVALGRPPEAGHTTETAVHAGRDRHGGAAIFTITVFIYLGLAVLLVYTGKSQPHGGIMSSKAAISLTTGLEDAEKATVAFLVVAGAAEAGRGGRR